MNRLHWTERQTPCRKWNWRCKRTGTLILATDKEDWLRKIEKFNADNGFEMPPDWREEAEHEVCMMEDPSYSRWQDGSKPHVLLAPHSKIDTVLHATRVFLAFVQNGGKLVVPEVAVERARTCAGCYAAVSPPGCGACNNLAGLVMDIVGQGTTPSDPYLTGKSCAWCGCSALANCWTPVSVSEKGVSDEMLEVGKNLPWCWKVREISELRASRIDSPPE